MGEHKIKYLPHKAIKGHALANLLVEIKQVAETIEEPPSANPFRRAPGIVDGKH